MLATGGQTAGSIIRPASYCGVMGYKPSLGKISIAGVKSLAISLDTIGCFGRNINDVGLGVAAMSGDHHLVNIEALHNTPRIAIYKTPQWLMAQQETVTAIAIARHAAEAISKTAINDIALPSNCEDIAEIQTRIMLSEMTRSLTF